MKTAPERALASAELAAYLESELSPSEMHRTQDLLAKDLDARRRLEQLSQIRAALSAPEPELESIDLVAAVQAARRQPARVAPRRPFWLWIGGGVSAAAAAALLFLSLDTRRSLEDQFQAKSGGAALPEARRWTGVQVYQVAAAGEPQQLAAQVSKKDGLLFAYTNLGPDPFEYLMLFAVGGSGEVFWFHPSYERVGMNPSSIKIEKGRAEVPLKEVIEHDFAPGPLSIYALFTRRPMRVLEVEAWLEKQRGSLRPLTAPADANLDVIVTEVRP